jgi:predicted secreted protein
MPWKPKLLLLIASVVLAEALTFGQDKGRVIVTDKEGDSVASDSDDGQIVKVKIKDELIVTLPVTPATGDVWHARHYEGLKETDKTHFELVEKGKPGARSMQVFQFSVEKKGKYILLLFTLDHGDELKRVCTFKLDARE